MSDIKWKLVESSNVLAIGYEEDTRELHVRFRGGDEYVYHDVPADVYRDFLDAPSQGKYLNEFIKGKFEFTKLD